MSSDARKAIDAISEGKGISYTVTREKAPLYTMGDVNPRSFTRGKRGIAGSTIFLAYEKQNRSPWQEADTFMEWDEDEDHTSR